MLLLLLLVVVVVVVVVVVATAEGVPYAVLAGVEIVLDVKLPPYS